MVSQLFKMGLYEFHINLCLHKIFELILFISIFDPNLKEQISETGEAMPKKIGLHAFHVNLYLHEFFEPILIFDPHGLYSPWSEGKFWPKFESK